METFLEHIRISRLELKPRPGAFTGQMLPGVRANAVVEIQLLGTETTVEVPVSVEVDDERDVFDRVRQKFHAFTQDLAAKAADWDPGPG